MALSNTQYNEIMHEYEIIQQENRADLEKRREYVYEHVPGYKELADSISKISVEFEISRLNGKKTDSAFLHDRLEDIRARQRILLHDAGLSENYLLPKYNCPDCKDTGYIGNKKCHCFNQRVVSMLYAQSHLQVLTRENNFKKLTEAYYTGEHLDHFRKAKQISINFIKNFDSTYQNLLFHGTVGTGKSFLSICIAKEVLDRGHSVVYYSSCDLFRKLTDFYYDFNKKTELANLCENIYNCELLIIDDLGTEISNAFVLAQLFTICNERELLKRSTIISTNLSLKEIQNRYHDRIFSRLAKNFQLLRLSGPDIRMQMAKKQN